MTVFSCQPTMNDWDLATLLSVVDIKRESRNRRKANKMERRKSYLLTSSPKVTGPETPLIEPTPNHWRFPSFRLQVTARLSLIRNVYIHKHIRYLCPFYALRINPRKFLSSKRTRRGGTAHTYAREELDDNVREELDVNATMDVEGLAADHHSLPSSLRCYATNIATHDSELFAFVEIILELNIMSYAQHTIRMCLR